MPLKAEARLDLTQLVSDDSVTNRHLIYTDLRATADVSLDWERPLALHTDVRARISANDVGPSRYDITRLYLEYGDPKKWAVAAGRISIDPVNQTLVDGARFTLGLTPGTHFEVFGGAMPHPILRTFNLDFLNFGAGYQSNSKTLNHGGGVSAQLYQGKLDRLFVTESAYARLSPTLSLFGRMVLDLVSQEGIIGQLKDTPADEQGAIEQVDVSQAYLTLKYRPAGFVDVSVSGSHVHTLLPNLWWQDWVDRERARLGFSLDGPLPVGTRRSTARVVSNLHFGPASPYLALRYDHRHEDGANGYEGRLGVKLARRGLGYVDAYGAHRKAFDAQHQLLGVQLGWTILEGVNLDAGAGALRVTAPQGEASWLFDVNTTAWVDLGTFSPSLRKVFVLGMYQAFIEPEVLYQVVTARLGYRISL